MNLFEYVVNVTLFVDGALEHSESIYKEVLFNFCVQGGVTVEGGGVVHFEEPGLTFGVDHDVEAEDLEAHVAVQVTRLARPVVVDEVWLH